jgi:hypothetical protein
MQNLDIRRRSGDFIMKAVIIYDDLPSATKARVTGRLKTGQSWALQNRPL